MNGGLTVLNCKEYNFTPDKAVPRTKLTISNIKYIKTKNLFFHILTIIIATIIYIVF